MVPSEIKGDLTHVEQSICTECHDFFLKIFIFLIAEEAKNEKQVNGEASKYEKEKTVTNGVHEMSVKQKEKEGDKPSCEETPSDEADKEEKPEKMDTSEPSDEAPKIEKPKKTNGIHEGNIKTAAAAALAAAAVKAKVTILCSKSSHQWTVLLKVVASSLSNIVP